VNYSEQDLNNMKVKLEAHLANYDWNNITPTEYTKKIPELIQLLTQTNDSKNYESIFEALFNRYSYAGIQFETTIAVASLMIDLLLDKNYPRKNWVLEILANIHTSPIDTIVSPKVYEQISRGIPSYQLYLNDYSPQMRHYVITILGNLHKHYDWALELLVKQLYIETTYQNKQQILRSINNLFEINSSISDKYKLLALDTLLTTITNNKDKFLKVYSAIIYTRIELINTPNEILAVIYDFIKKQNHITNDDFILLNEIGIIFADLRENWLLGALDMVGTNVAASLFASKLIGKVFPITNTISLFYRLVILSQKQKEILEFLLEHPLLWHKKWGTLPNYGLEDTKESLTQQVKSSIIIS